MLPKECPNFSKTFGGIGGGGVIQPRIRENLRMAVARVCFLWLASTATYSFSVRTVDNASWNFEVGKQSMGAEFSTFSSVYGDHVMMIVLGFG